MKNDRELSPDHFSYCLVVFSLDPEMFALRLFRDNFISYFVVCKFRFFDLSLFAHQFNIEIVHCPFSPLTLVFTRQHLNNILTFWINFSIFTNA
jgi:hypothetical protein